MMFAVIAAALLLTWGGSVIATYDATYVRIQTG